MPTAITDPCDGIPPTGVSVSIGTWAHVNGQANYPVTINAVTAETVHEFYFKVRANGGREYWTNKKTFTLTCGPLSTTI